MHGTNQVTRVHGDYRPLERRRNNIRISGWKTVEQTGSSLSWDDTYFDTFTAAVVSGASSQFGTPTPTAPVQIVSVGEAGIGDAGIDITVRGDSGQSYAVHRDIVLRGLPDGTCDEWDVLSGTVTRRIDEWKMNSGVWASSQWAARGIFHRSGMNSPTYIVMGTGANIRCSHFPPTGESWGRLPENTIQLPSNIDGGHSVIVCKPVIDGVTDLASWTNWLAENDPVIYFTRAAPQIEQIEPAPLPAYPRYTALECGAYLTASARVVDKTI